MKNAINNAAPKCILPECNNHVGYHGSAKGKNGIQTAKWKTFCNFHRTIGKLEADQFKLLRGCENKYGSVGISVPCAGYHPVAVSLTIDHYDGNKLNTDPSNVLVLCANCHNIKTQEHGNHLTRYGNRSQTNFDEHFEG
jgi:hypothetical protein